MFAKVLVANRGEIACRIIRTLRRMGIGSVAVYSEPDARSLHVVSADEAVCVGPAPARESYLDVDRVLAAAMQTGARAVHPGYGFLSENAEFAEAAEARGIAFIGPTPDQIRRFGLKHTARALAEECKVPLLPGTGIVADVEEALQAAQRIGFPVMLKSTGGGGGIGLRLVASAAELRAAFDSVQRLGEAHFKHAGVYVERYVAHARHVEVQILGDGNGGVVTIGERDCSLQRRNQKVVEETPAPGLSDTLRASLAASAVELMKSVRYRSAGTVEFIVDAERGSHYFLEVNTRLQVEHCVTEEVYGLDLVEWMVRIASGDAAPLDTVPRTPRGHAMEARVYAEDPAKTFQPSSGLLTEVTFPEGVRTDTWVERGTEVSAFYDPLLAKVVVHGETREAAAGKLAEALDATRLSGIETNIDYLRQVVRHAEFVRGGVTTALLASVRYAPSGIDVLAPGTQSTIQDHPGRVGYWAVGIPPSGPMNSLSLRLGNRVVGNADGAAALEMTMSGPTLAFRSDTLFALTGAEMGATLDGVPVPRFTPVKASAGQRLAVGGVKGPGARGYLCVRGGFDVPEYLGSCSTFTLGGFGGHAGRALRTGDVLHVANPGKVKVKPRSEPRPLPPEAVPRLTSEWEIGVLEGPHAAPDFFDEAFIRDFYEVKWKVHYNSARTGVRLIGPKPAWAREDGGEAGLHPSNIHDTAYAIGTVDFTGDMPILLGPDGPSLGGFVCPATIVTAELWKMGQLKPGDTVLFRPWSLETAERAERRVEELVATFAAPPASTFAVERSSGVVRELAESVPVRVTYRRSGDRYLLVEYGPMVLDLKLRLRVHLLMQALEEHRVPGLVDLTPGIRSLQIHYDRAILPLSRLLEILGEVEMALGSLAGVRVPSRIVRLPLSWDDPATRLAIEKYVQSVRPDAPWAPSNIEFIRRINGLGSEDDVKRIVYGASYLVLGLGDVYLGAPVATPIDPRHRLVTTKYNPARTWTPENAVGIGGAYLCIYGMEGPGGYQFVGRTLQVYNRFKETRSFGGGKPWLLRFFDRIHFYPVSAKELLEMREGFTAGRFDVSIEEGQFSFDDYEALLVRERASIAAAKATQQRAFDEERERSIARGQLQFSSESEDGGGAETAGAAVPAGARSVESHVSGSIWKIQVEVGEKVDAGAPLVVVESMKMEVTVEAPCAGTVIDVVCREGKPVSAGQAVVVMREDLA